MDNTQPAQPNTAKAVDIQLTPGGTFVAILVTALATYVPIVGPVFSMNYMMGWIADNTMLSGRKIKFTATFGETFKFMFVNILLLIITFGIYMFWYIPNIYKYVSEHIEFTS